MTPSPTPIDLEALDALKTVEGDHNHDYHVRLDCRRALVNAYPSLAAELRSARSEIERLTELLRAAQDVVEIFLGEDDQFQVAVGGNPIAVDKMLMGARSLLATLNEPKP